MSLDKIWIDAQAWLAANGWLILLTVVLPFALAWLVARFSGWIARRLTRFGRVAWRAKRPSIERQLTLEALNASAISLLAFVLAGVFVVSRYVAADTLLWVVGLFSAAFGFGARLAGSFRWPRRRRKDEAAAVQDEEFGNEPDV